MMSHIYVCIHIQWSSNLLPKMKYFCVHVFGGGNQIQGLIHVKYVFYHGATATAQTEAFLERESAIINYDGMEAYTRMSLAKNDI